MNNVKKFLDEIKVYDCNLTKTRIGNKHDGGYVALRELCEKTDIIYSAGIGEDVGFELDFVERFPLTKANLFDPTIESLPEEHEKFDFFRQKIDQYIIDNVPDNCLLKMDIEWDEWKTFLNLESDFSEFCQLLIEFHLVHAEPRNGLSPYFHSFYQSAFDKINDELFDMYCGIMEILNYNFYIFHIHANNSLPMITIQNYSLPPLIELSFVRKDLVDYVELSTIDFPVIGLDFPNKSDRGDVNLGDFKNDK